MKTKDTLKEKPKRVSNIRAARRLMARLIYDLQRENITSEKAKTLAYLLIKYSELFKVEKLEELENRLKRIEEKIDEKS